MIPQPFEYAAPKTIEEALALLGNGAKPLAGGHSLIPLMKLRLAAPEQLVDLRKLRELNFVREREGAVAVGAMTTHYDIETSAVLRAQCPLLAETAGHIGDTQVRNMGTIGGSLAHADPAADYPAALLALEAQVALRSSAGERTLAFADFLLDTFTTALEPGEIVCEVTVPAEEPATGVWYEKVAQPASGFALVGVAVRVRRSGGPVSMARVGITGLGAKAYRARGVEAALEGTAGGPEDLVRAAAEADAGVDASSDLHASANYRRHLARVHTARALAAALKRAS